MLTRLIRSVLGNFNQFEYSQLSEVNDSDLRTPVPFDLIVVALAVAVFPARVSRDRQHERSRSRAASFAATDRRTTETPF